MITRSNSRCGEGEVVEGDTKVGSRRRKSQGEEMVEEGRSDHPFGSVGFVDSFMTLRAMVEEMYHELK